MKIVGNPNVQRIMKAYNKDVEATKKTTGPKFESDKIEISQQAHDYQLAMKALNKLPDTRGEKVEEVKSQLDSGNYKPSSEDILNKILERIKG